MTQELRNELEAIRDIPYRFGISEGDMGVTCYEKTLRAKACLETHGYATRFRCGAFQWSDVAFPADIRSRITNDSAEHVWVEYEEDGTRHVLDLTFDRALAGAVPVQWVNMSPALSHAVPIQEVYSVERSADIMKQLEDTQTLECAHKDDLARNKDFYTLVNVYFEGVRVKRLDQVKVGIGVLVIKDGKSLFCRRASAHAGGFYGFPGGHLEWMETIEEGAKREVREEAGIEITNVRLVRVNNLTSFAPKHYVDIAVVADWLSGEPRVCEPDMWEGEWRWYPLDQLPQPIFPTIPKHIEAYLGGEWTLGETV